MSEQTTKAIVTRVGNNKILDALDPNSTNSVVVTHMAIGDGLTVHGGGETELYNETFRKPLSRGGIVTGANNTVYFDLDLSADEGPFTIRELGAFDEDGELIAVAHYNPAIEKTLPQSGQSQSGTLRINVVVADSGVIVFDVDNAAFVLSERAIDTDTGLAGGGDLSQDRTLITDWSNLPAPIGIIRSHIINLRQGTGQKKVTTGGLADWLVNELSLTTRADDERLVKFSDIWITANVTYTVGPNSDYATINDAMDFLRNYLIADDVTVTLALTAGVHTYNDDIIINHPNARRIKIIGADMTGANPVLADFTATGHTQGQRDADNTVNLSMLRSKFATEILMDQSSFFCLNGLGLLSNILFVGQSTLSEAGLTFIDGTYDFSNLSVHGFNNTQITFSDSRVFLRSGISVTGGEEGLVANSSYVTTHDQASPYPIISFGNSLTGLGFNLGTEVFNLATHCRGNGASGLSVARNASAHLTKQIISDAGVNGLHGAQAFMANLDAENFISYNNASIGVAAQAGSTILMNGTAQIVGNGFGTYADTGSFIDVAGADTANNATETTPAFNTVGNQNSYIRK